MKSYSNTYIFIFSLIMVTVVAVLLSFVAMQIRWEEPTTCPVSMIKTLLSWSSSINISTTPTW